MSNGLAGFFQDLIETVKPPTAPEVQAAFSQVAPVPVVPDVDAITKAKIIHEAQVAARHSSGGALSEFGKPYLARDF